MCMVEAKDDEDDNKQGIKYKLVLYGYAKTLY